MSRNFELNVDDSSDDEDAPAYSLMDSWKRFHKHVKHNSTPLEAELYRVSRLAPNDDFFLFFFFSLHALGTKVLYSRHVTSLYYDHKKELLRTDATQMPPDEKILSWLTEAAKQTLLSLLTPFVEEAEKLINRIVNKKSLQLLMLNKHLLFREDNELIKERLSEYIWELADDIISDLDESDIAFKPPKPVSHYDHSVDNNRFIKHAKAQAPHCLGEFLEEQKKKDFSIVLVKTSPKKKFTKLKKKHNANILNGSFLGAYPTMGNLLLTALTGKRKVYLPNLLKALNQKKLATDYLTDLVAQDATEYDNCNSHAWQKAWNLNSKRTGIPFLYYYLTFGPKRLRSLIEDNFEALFLKQLRANQKEMGIYIERRTLPDQMNLEKGNATSFLANLRLCNRGIKREIVQAKSDCLTQGVKATGRTFQRAWQFDSNPASPMVLETHTCSVNYTRTDLVINLGKYQPIQEALVKALQDINKTRIDGAARSDEMKLKDKHIARWMQALIKGQHSLPEIQDLKIYPRHI